MKPLIKLCSMFGFLLLTSTLTAEGLAEQPQPNITSFLKSESSMITERDAIASGDECPSGSGSYCSDTSPVCCLVSGTYGCYKKLSDCVEPQISSGDTEE